MKSLAESFNWQRLGLKIPRWSRLRELGQLSVVKATILIPVLGYAALFNDEVMRYLRLSSLITGEPGDPAISWRLLLVYFGLCCIAAASALYAYFCPAVIKAHSSGSEFVDKECDALGEIRLNLLEQKLKNERLQEYTRLRDVIDRRVTDNLQEAANYPGYKQLLRDNAVDIMQFYYAGENHDRPWVRLGVASLFAFGFLLLAIPSLNVFFRCVGLLMKAM